MTERLVSTFSVAAVDVRTGEYGVACASKFLAVGSLVPWVQADVGAIATQALVNASLGVAGLELLAAGETAAETLRTVLADDANAARRQIGVVDRHGGSAAHTGGGCSPFAGHRTGPGYACQGNLLAGPEVLDAMVGALTTAEGSLSRRLIAVLTAADAAGGDRRGRQSAGVVVRRRAGGYQGLTDTVMDLRVDDHPDPVAEIRRLEGLHDLYLRPGPPEDRLPMDGTVLAELCALSEAAGLLAPGTPAAWTDAVQRAIDTLTGMANLEERTDIAARTIDRTALEVLRAAKARR